MTESTPAWHRLIPGAAAQRANAARVIAPPSRTPFRFLKPDAWVALPWIEDGVLDDGVCVVPEHSKGGGAGGAGRDERTVMLLHRGGVAGAPPSVIVLDNDARWMRVEGLDGDANFQPDERDTGLSIRFALQPDLQAKLAELQAALVAAVLAARRALWGDGWAHFEKCSDATLCQQVLRGFGWKPPRARTRTDESDLRREAENEHPVVRPPMPDEWPGGLKTKLPARAVVVPEERGGRAELEDVFLGWAPRRDDRRWLRRADITPGSQALAQLALVRFVYPTASIAPYAHWTCLGGVVLPLASGGASKDRLHDVADRAVPPPGEALALPGDDALPALSPPPQSPELLGAEDAALQSNVAASGQEPDSESYGKRPRLY